MDETQRLLAPLRRDRGTHAALDGISDRFRIAPPATRQIFDGLDRGLVRDVVEPPTVCGELGDTDQFDDWLADQRPSIVEHDRDGHDADKAKPAAVGDRAVLRINNEAAILVKPALRHFIDDARRAGRKPDHVAIAAHQSVGHSYLSSERGVLGKMQRLAVDRHHDARPHPAIKIFKLGPAWMAGDMDEVGAIGDHLDTLANKTVDDTTDGLLVARNGAR